VQHLRLLAALTAAVITVSCASASRKFRGEAIVDETIVALERAALDRWGKGDPQGYLETYAPEITYFDPHQERRVDGLAAMRQLLAPIAGMVKVDRFEMIGAKVQRHGDVAVLSYNLVSHARRPSGDPVVVRWNSTAVYTRLGGQWKIIHSHWSYTRPDLSQPR
jgi:ketosteroid isomerase-like protein